MGIVVVCAVIRCVSGSGNCGPLDVFVCAAYVSAKVNEHESRCRNSRHDESNGLLNIPIEFKQKSHCGCSD